MYVGKYVTEVFRSSRLLNFLLHTMAKRLYVRNFVPIMRNCITNIELKHKNYNNVDIFSVEIQVLIMLTTIEV